MFLAEKELLYWAESPKKSLKPLKSRQNEQKEAGKVINFES